MIKRIADRETDLLTDKLIHRGALLQKNVNYKSQHFTFNVNKVYAKFCKMSSNGLNSCGLKEGVTYAPVNFVRGVLIMGNDRSIVANLIVQFDIGN